MKNKKIIISVIVVLAVLAVGIGAYFIIKSNNQSDNFVQISEDGTKINNSSKLTKDKEIEGLKISDLKLTEKGNVTQLRGTITNTTKEVKEEGIIKITFLDKDGNEMTTIEPYVQKLQPGESTTLNASTTFDYSNAYDIKITK